MGAKEEPLMGRYLQLHLCHQVGHQHQDCPEVEKEETRIILTLIVSKHFLKQTKTKKEGKNELVG